MADIASLAMEIRTGDVTRARAELDKLTAAGSRAERSADHLTRTASGLGTAMRGVIGALGVGELIRLTDAHTKYTAQLRLATSSAHAFGFAQDQVRRIAKDAQADIAAVGTLYARISKSTQTLNISQTKVAEIAEVVALSMKASGAGASEQASAMLQLSQAFASGVLRGEEFNAVNEAAPRLMQALADGIGKPVGALRDMATQGLLTSKVLADALPKALEAVRKEAAQVQTIGGSFTVLRNAMIEFVGTQAKASGAVAALTTGVEALARNLDTLAAAAIGIGAAKLAGVLLRTVVAAKESAAGALAHAGALQAERVAALGMAQAAAQEAAATLAGAAADVAASRATIANLQATEATIVAYRAEVVVALQRTDATIASTAATLAAARASGALSASLATARAAEAALAVEQGKRAILVGELALLGRQQASVRAATTAALAGETAAAGANTAALAANATAQRVATTAAAGAGVGMGLARGALAALGGPIGLVTTLLGLGATAWVLYGNRAKEAGEKTAESMRDTLRETIRSTSDQSAKLDAVAKSTRDRAARARAAGQDMFASDLDARAANLERLSKGLSDKTAAALSAVAEIERGINSDLFKSMEHDPRFSEESIRAEQKAALAKFLESNQTKAEKFAAAIAKAKSEMGEFFSADVEKRIRSDIFGDGRAKTVNDGRLDALKIEASTEQSIFQSRNAALQTYHSAALISDDAFYAGREATRAEYIATLQRQFAQEQAVLQQQLATAPADKRADAQRELNQATADYNEKLRGIAESAGAEELERIARARAFVTEATDMSTKAVIAELANMAAGNKALRDEIALLGATEEAKAAVEKARIRSIRTLKEEQLAQMEAANAGGLLAEAQLRQLELEIQLLKEREDLIGQRQRKVADVKVRDDNIKASEELGKQTHEDVKDALARAFQDSKDPVGAFADALGNSIYTRLTSRITDALATAAVGKDGSGGMFGGLFAGVFGGGDKGQGVGNTGAGEAITKLGETTSLATAKLAEEAATTAASTALTALGTTSVPSASFAVGTFTQALGVAQGALYALAGSSSASGAEGLITSLVSSFVGGGPGAPGGGVDYSLPSDGVRFGGGRASGGSTQRKAMYQVAEGDKPELYREDGRTYLMTGDRGGMVTPARSFDGGGQAAAAQPIINKINIINNAQARVKTQQRQDGGLDVLIEQIEGALGQRVDNGVGLARNVGGRFGLNSGAGLVR